MGNGVTTSQETRLAAKSIDIHKSNVVHGELYCDKLSGDGRKNAVCNTLAELPLFTENTDDSLDSGEYPTFYSGRPGAENVIVKKRGTATIDSSEDYGDVVVQAGGTLTPRFTEEDNRLDARSITLRRNSTLSIEAFDDVEIRVKEQVITGARVSIGPVNSATDASNIVFYVENSASDGSDIIIGARNDVDATIYVDLDQGHAKSTLFLNAFTQATGAFIAPRTVVGSGTRVT